MEIKDGKAFLTPEELRLTLYEQSPVSLELFDLFPARQRLIEREDALEQRVASDDELDHTEIGAIWYEKSRIQEDKLALDSLAAQLAAHHIRVPVTDASNN